MSKSSIEEGKFRTLQNQVSGQNYEGPSGSKSAVTLSLEKFTKGRLTSPRTIGVCSSDGEHKIISPLDMVEMIMAQFDKKGGSSSGTLKAKKEAEGKRPASEMQETNLESGGKIGRGKKTVRNNKRCVASKEFRALLDGTEDGFDERQVEVNI